MVEISLSSGQAAQRYRDLAAQLRQADRVDLRRALRARIADAGRPVLADVRAAVRNLRSTSTGGGGADARRRHNVTRARAGTAKDRAERRGAGLRETIASATTLQITAKGIRFVVRSDRLPEDQRTLPRHMDSDKGWRHPVFGNRTVWVAQRAGPWFGATIKKRAPDFRDAVVQAMEDTKEALEQ